LVDENDAELARIVDSTRPEDETHGVGVVEQTRRMLQAWGEEILCDLNAVRLFGPAGLNAIAEFLSVLRPSGTIGKRSNALGAEAPTASHPRLSLRITAMLEFLRLQGEKAVPDELEPWQSYTSATRAALGQRAAYLEAKAIQALPSLFSQMLSWGETYVHSARTAEVCWIRDQLLDGVPGGTHCLGAELRGSPLQVADVINASWKARQDLDDGEVVGAGGALLSSAIDPHERRVILDRLTGKSVDDLEFSLLWKNAGRRVVNLGAAVPSSAEDAPESEDPPAGVLSRRDIEERLRRGDSRRVIVTPLMDGSVQDAGIDLRLSPDFVVFRHSATTAFDPLRRSQNPRGMQEVVTKVWGEPFILHPAELVLASTLEYIVLPSDVTAQVVTRSSYGRLGLITATAVQVQPGSRGCITFELVNHGETPIALTPGTRIAQLVLLLLSGSPHKYTTGTYRFPVGPEFSKVQEDLDAPVLRQLRNAVYDVGRAVKHAERPPFPGRQVKFIASLDFDDAASFQMTVDPEQVATEIVPLAEVQDEAPGETMARIVGGEAIVGYLLSGATSLTMLSMAVLRLVRGLKRGVIITAVEGEVEVRPDPGLPRGSLVLVKDPKDKYQVTVDDGTVGDDLAKAIGQVLEKKQSSWVATEKRSGRKSVVRKPTAGGSGDQVPGAN